MSTEGDQENTNSAYSTYVDNTYTVLKTDLEDGKVEVTTAIPIVVRLMEVVDNYDLNGPAKLHIVKHVIRLAAQHLNIGSDILTLFVSNDALMDATISAIVTASRGLYALNKKSGWCPKWC